MRIAGAILAIFPLSIIIFVQAAASGVVDAIDDNGGSGGTLGFLVGILYIIGAALLFGKAMRVALAVWTLSALAVSRVAAAFHQK